MKTRLLPVLVTALAGCGPALNVNTLEIDFNKTAQVAPKQLLSKTAYGWSSGELGTLPTATSIPGTSVVYHATNVKAANPSEVYLFDRDPEEVRQALELEAYQYFKWRDTVVSPSVLPRVVVVPFPPNASFDLQQSVNVDLLEAQFWDGANITGTAAQPSGHGSVKALRVLQRGLCATEVPAVATFLQPVEKEVWEQVRDKLRAAPKISCHDINIYRYYDRTILYMGHASGVPLDVTGGFMLQFSVGLRGPITDISLYADFEYELGLDDGILAVTHAKENNVLGVGNAGLEQAARDALTNLLPTIFRQRTLDQQTLVIPGQTSACTPLDATGATDTASCGNVVSQVMGGVALGGPSVGLSMSDVTALQKTLGEKTNGVFRNWRCVPPPSGGAAGCGLVLRARRINVLPDAIEMVWFDDNDLKSTAFALWVALHAPNVDQTPIQTMCGPKPEHGLQGSPPAYTRSFAQHDLGAEITGSCEP
jgi:hypothetical protein